MAGQGDSRTPRRAVRPLWWRVLSVSLAAAALVLWAFSGWSWWAAVPVIGGLILVRLPLALFPPLWRQWAANWAVAVLALIVVLWLVTMVSSPALGVAAGVAGLVLVWQIRGVLPRWSQWVAAGIAAALILGCGLAAWLSWLADEERREANEREDRAYRIAQMRPDHPTDAFLRLVEAVAIDEPYWACFLFNNQGKAAFAKAVGTDTCEAAIHKLHGQVDPERQGVYAGSKLPADAVVRADNGTSYVSACDMYAMKNFDYIEPPGPQLGQLTLQPDPKYRIGLIATNYTPCDQEVPGKPSTKPAPPANLPTYAPGIARLLTEAISGRDTDVCGYFTDRGRERLAAAAGADTCEHAIEAFAAKVTDSTVYATPEGVTTSTTPEGTTVVNACQLTWTEWGQGTGAAVGPQLGHLVLVQPKPGTPGYLIDDVRPC